VLELHGTIEKSPVFLRFIETTLVFENRHHRCVGDPAALEQCLVNAAAGGMAEFPDHLQDFQFLVGERSLRGRILSV